MNPPAIPVAAGLIFRDGKLLLTQRFHDSHLGGLWEFPGGKVEAGETFEEALRRELTEELGIDVAVLQRVASIEHEYPEKAVSIQFFKCRILSGEPDAIGCAALAWAAPDELKRYKFPAADAALLVQLLDDKELWLGG